MDREPRPKPIVGKRPPATLAEHVVDFANRIESQDALADQLTTAAGRLGTKQRAVASLDQTGYRQVSRGIMYMIGTGGVARARAALLSVLAELDALDGEDVDRLTFAMTSLLDLATVDVGQEYPTPDD